MIRPSETPQFTHEIEHLQSMLIGMMLVAPDPELAAIILEGYHNQLDPPTRRLLMTISERDWTESERASRAILGGPAWEGAPARHTAVVRLLQRLQDRVRRVATITASFDPGFSAKGLERASEASLKATGHLKSKLNTKTGATA